MEDLSKYGTDIVSELEDQLANELAKEIDKQILKNIMGEYFDRNKRRAKSIEKIFKQ